MTVHISDWWRWAVWPDRTPRGARPMTAVSRTDEPGVDSGNQFFRLISGCQTILEVCCWTEARVVPVLPGCGGSFLSILMECCFPFLERPTTTTTMMMTTSRRPNCFPRAHWNPYTASGGTWQRRVASMTLNGSFRRPGESSCRTFETLNKPCRILESPWHFPTEPIHRCTANVSGKSMPGWNNKI